MTSPSPNPSSAAADEWTVRRIIDWTTDYLARSGSETPRLDTEVLLAHVRDCPRIELYTRFAEVLTSDERAAMRELVRRRAAAEPVAYLVGHREFYGLDFRVTKDVLIPRPDTETLVMELLETARRFASPRILDIGTGSGCIAVAVAVNSPPSRFVATDISPAALEVARDNARRHAVADRIDFRHGDLFAPFADGERFEIIAANLPYVTAEEMETLQPDVRLHEPHSALVAGADGLAVIRRLIADAPLWLVHGGALFLEIAPEQHTAVTELLAAGSEFNQIQVLKDVAGQMRVVTAVRR